MATCISCSTVGGFIANSSSLYLKNSRLCNPGLDTPSRNFSKTSRFLSSVSSRGKARTLSPSISSKKALTGSWRRCFLELKAALAWFRVTPVPKRREGSSDILSPVMNWIPRGVQLDHQPLIGALPSCDGVNEYLKLLSSEAIGGIHQRPLT